MDTKQVHQEVLDAYSAHDLDRPMARRAAEYTSAPDAPGGFQGREAQRRSYEASAAVLTCTPSAPSRDQRRHDRAQRVGRPSGMSRRKWGWPALTATTR